MLKTRPRPATYSDIEALPPNMVGEIIHGVLHAHPRPAPRHGRAAIRLRSEISGPLDYGRGGPCGWIFIVEPELRLGPHVVVPDIAGWKTERLAPFARTAYVETPPDLLCGVLSPPPPTQALDRTEKLVVYAEYGVGHCWYLVPMARTLEVFALTGGKWLLAAAFKEADPVTAPPFEAHTFPLDVLWVRES